MNIAVILAAGADPTFRMDIPKQFVNVYNRPVIVYTMETFQQHPEIDAIMVACLKGWESMVEAYAKQFDITKLEWVIQGGGFGQETSKRAVDRLAEECDGGDIIILMMRFVRWYHIMLFRTVLTHAKEKGWALRR